MTAKPIAARSFIGNFALVFLAIALLFMADTFLARTDRTESRIEAVRLFTQGQMLLSGGHSREAVERINDAIAIERDNRDFIRTLAQAQFAAGQNTDAAATLTGLLNADPSDGPANLLMGRVLVKQGRASEATSFFHRAIYGVWPQNAESNKLSARLELIDLLAEQNAKEELLAELLPIQANPPLGLATRLHIASLFVRAGSASRAAEAYRGILQDSPNNPEALKGMGQAEFSLGDYRAAQRDFESVLRAAPSDAFARHWLDLCNQLFSLDPVLRGLGAGERWHRSVALLQLLVTDASECAAPGVQDLLTKAAVAAKANVPAVHQSEAAEKNLDLAEQLWQLRKAECKPLPSEDSVLALVLARLTR